MRDDMRKGDLAFFYHSSCPSPGIVGICEIVSGAYPDHTAFDADSKYFDAKSDPENPRWLMVDVKYRRMPVDKPHWDFILSLEESSDDKP